MGVNLLLSSIADTASSNLPPPQSPSLLRTPGPALPVLLHLLMPKAKALLNTLFGNAATSLPISQRTAHPLPPPQRATSCPSCFTQLPGKHCLELPLAVKRRDLNSCGLWGAAGYHCRDKNGVIIHTYIRTRRRAHTPCPHPGPCPAFAPVPVGPFIYQTHAHFHIFGVCVMQHLVICSQAVCLHKFHLPNSFSQTIFNWPYLLSKTTSTLPSSPLELLEPVPNTAWEAPTGHASHTC